MPKASPSDLIRRAQYGGTEAMHQMIVQLDPILRKYSGTAADDEAYSELAEWLVIAVRKYPRTSRTGTAVRRTRNLGVRLPYTRHYESASKGRLLRGFQGFSSSELCWGPLTLVPQFSLMTVSSLPQGVPDSTSRGGPVSHQGFGRT